MNNKTNIDTNRPKPLDDDAAREAALRLIGSAPDPAAVTALNRIADLLWELDSLFAWATVGEPGTAEELTRIYEQLEPIWQRLRRLAEREDPRYTRAAEACLV
jgi:hypothetical protein